MRTILLAGVCAIASVACGAQVTPLDGGGGDANVSPDAPIADVGVDAPSTADIVDVPVDAPQTPGEGFVEAIVDSMGASSADAHFYTLPPNYDCNLTVRDTCEVRVCRHPPGTSFIPVDAGAIELMDDMHQAITSLQTTPATTGDYRSGPLPTNYWLPGAMVRFRGAGAVFPAFDTMLAFPGRITLVGFTPEYDDRSVVIDRSRPLVFRWMPAPNTSLVVRISVSNGMESGNLRCTFAGAGNAIPAEVLALLPLTGPDAGGIDISAANEADVVLGNSVLHARTANVLFRESAGTR